MTHICRLSEEHIDIRVRLNHLWGKVTVQKPFCLQLGSHIRGSFARKQVPLDRPDKSNNNLLIEREHLHWVHPRAGKHNHDARLIQEQDVPIVRKHVKTRGAPTEHVTHQVQSMLLFRHRHKWQVPPLRVIPRCTNYAAAHL